MARISTYPLDSTVVGTDRLIGTDQDNATSTKNYTISDLGAYFGTLTTGKVWIGDAQGQKAEGDAVFSLIAGTNITVDSPIGDVTVSSPNAIVNTTDTYATENVTNVISLTQVEYDAIVAPNVNTLYIIL